MNSSPLSGHAGEDFGLTGVVSPCKVLSPQKPWQNFLFLPLSSEKAEEIGRVRHGNGWSPSTAQISRASAGKAAIFAALCSAGNGTTMHWHQLKLKCNEDPGFTQWILLTPSPWREKKKPEKALFLCVHKAGTLHAQILPAPFPNQE